MPAARCTCIIRSSRKRSPRSARRSAPAWWSCPARRYPRSARRRPAGVKPSPRSGARPSGWPRKPAWHGAGGAGRCRGFGESAVLPRAASRGAGPAACLTARWAPAQRGGQGGTPLIERLRTADGTVGLRGAMVPTHAFPTRRRAGLRAVPGARSGRPGRHRPRLPPQARRQHADRQRPPPAGMATVGGYRFSRARWKRRLAAVDADATWSLCPTALLGQRLAGSAPERAAIVAALQARGLNPLHRQRLPPAAAADAA